MYHEITDSQIKKRRQHVCIVTILLIVVIVAALAIGNVVRVSTRQQGALALQESILSTAKQACSIEGSYPSTLKHLEENYGLVINHTDYVVSYECFAGNIVPSVVVVPR